MLDPAALLMLRGVVATCADCGDETIMIPVEGSVDELCCTACDAAFVASASAYAA